MARSSDDNPPSLNLHRVNALSHNRDQRAAVEPPFNASPPRQYDLFMAYSHRADIERAARLRDSLERIGPSFWNTTPALRVFREPPALRVFQDKKILPASARLWPDICDAIDGSKWFVLLASPQSANSGWVGREIERWLATKSSAQILIICTDGEWHWDATTGDFDFDRSSAINRALTRAFDHEPRIVDMTWATSARQMSLRNDLFLDVVADIAAPIHRIRKDDLVRQRQVLRWAHPAILGIATACALRGVMTVAVRRRHQSPRPGRGTKKI